MYSSGSQFLYIWQSIAIDQIFYSVFTDVMEICRYFTREQCSIQSHCKHFRTRLWCLCAFGGNWINNSKSVRVIYSIFKKTNTFQNKIWADTERGQSTNFKRQLLSPSLKELEVCDTGDVAFKVAVKALLVHNLDPGHFLIHWSDVQVRTSRDKNLCWRQGVVMQVFIHFQCKIK